MKPDGAFQVNQPTGVSGAVGTQGEIIVRHRLKVPGLALAAAFLLAACGGDAESAADEWSDPIDPRVEADGGDLGGEVDAPPPAADPATPEAPLRETAPPPASAPPAADPPRDAAAAPPHAEPVLEPRAEREFAEPAPVAIPAGATISATLSSTISTRTHRTGDVFQARVVEEVLAADGMVLVPEGARLEGRVVEARPSDGADEEAVLILAFDRLIMDGATFPLRGTVVGTEMETEARDSGTRSAAKVATGAAAGAVLGQILGRDTRSTVVGAAAGAAAGAGVAIATRDGHAQAQEGSLVVVQVDEPVILASGR